MITSDPTTIAYIALGARAAIAAMVKANIEHDSGSGELELVEDCIRHAPMLDTLANELCPDGCSGVFAYEVAEPFGEEFGAALLAGAAFDAEAVGRRLIAEMEQFEVEPA